MAAGIFLWAALFAVPGTGMKARAAGDVQIAKGVFAEDIELSGLSEAEAAAKIQAFLREAGSAQITLIAGGGNKVTVTADELGLSWANPGLVKEAAVLTSGPNVIECYKAIKDLEYENKVYDIDLDFDIDEINRVLTQECTRFDQKAQDYTLSLEDGVFVVNEGVAGYALDVERSIDIVDEYLRNEWDYRSCEIKLDVENTVPRGANGELDAVGDVLGTYTTSFSTSGSSRSANVRNGCSLINGTTLYPGEEFSTLQTITPFTEANGYYLAGSYMNGQVVESFGGGICQVSTTLYNAVLLAELQVSARSSHSMIVNYVAASADAAIAESSGKDFRFVNSSDYPIYIEGRTTSDKKITFTVYGKETRDTVNRKVRYESEVLETINPTTDNITANANLGFGYITVSSAHIGYKAKLWKIVTENGTEVSREVVNSSNYKMVPRSAVVGVATDNPDAYNAIMGAIATGNVDEVKAVIAAYTPAPEQPAAQDIPPEVNAPAEGQG